MKTSSPLIFILLLLGLILAPSTQNTAHEFDSRHWAITFSDEFDGDKLDPRKWTPKPVWEVVINNELQAYTPDSFEVRDGTLKVIANREEALYDRKVMDFKSGKMTTAGKFSQKYGKFEIRCKCPAGKGLWPAFWMLPDPPAWPPEIDVIEFLGHEKNKMYMSQHWPVTKVGKDGSDSVTTEFIGPDFTANFHIFTVEWEEGEIRWYVDHILRAKSNRNVPDVPMFLLVNLAVGGEWPGSPDAQTPFPSYFEVDYIRVWRKRLF